MDTSEEYIKMCDCPKIQEGQGYPINSSKDEICYLGNSVYADVDTCSTTWRTVWLPRQDQIQEMCREHFAQEMGSKRPHDEWFPKGDIGLGYVFNGFIKFASDYMREIYNSFEQLWLAFYMFEKHDKIWNGKRWK